MEQKIIILGHTVSYDDNSRSGIYFLTHELDAQEQEVFFDQAYSHGFAVFEDHMDKKYKLVHHGSEYQLVKS